MKFRIRNCPAHKVRIRKLASPLSLGSEIVMPIKFRIRNCHSHEVSAPKLQWRPSLDARLEGAQSMGPQMFWPALAKHTVGNNMLRISFSRRNPRIHPEVLETQTNQTSPYRCTVHRSSPRFAFQSKKERALLAAKGNRAAAPSGSKTSTTHGHFWLRRCGKPPPRPCSTQAGSSPTTWPPRPSAPCP